MRGLGSCSTQGHCGNQIRSGGSTTPILAISSHSRIPRSSQTHITPQSRAYASAKHRSALERFSSAISAPMAGATLRTAGAGHELARKVQTQYSPCKVMHAEHAEPTQHCRSLEMRRTGVRWTSVRRQTSARLGAIRRLDLRHRTSQLYRTSKRPCTCQTVADADTLVECSNAPFQRLQRVSVAPVRRDRRGALCHLMTVKASMCQRT